MKRTTVEQQLAWARAELCSVTQAKDFAIKERDQARREGAAYETNMRLARGERDRLKDELTAALRKLAIIIKLMSDVAEQAQTVRVL